MTVRERILAMKLLEQQKKNPEYLKKIGVQVRMNQVESTTIERGEKRDV